MEPDEISVVLARAAELHGKISDAIERSMNSEFRLTSMGSRSTNIGQENENVSVSLLGASAARNVYGKDYNHENSERDGAAEARSLASIRDALEVLEEQLECLQTLQQQQRAEKDATLAELEESRRILLRRLKEHHGREWEVVNEALSFAGEPMQERDDLPLPPYPMPLADASSFANLDHQFPLFGGSLSVQGNGAVKRPVLADGEEESGQDMSSEDSERNEGSEGDEVSACEDDVQTVRIVNGGLLGCMRSNFFKILTGRLGQTASVSAKIFLIVVSAAAVAVLSDAAQRRQTNKESLSPRGVSTRSNPSILMRQKPQGEICPPGKMMIVQDGVQRCVVKERVELPFQQNVKTPDVSYGLG